MSVSPARSAKALALAQHGALHPKPQAVRDPLFLQSEFFDPRDLVQVKYEMLRRVDADGQTITATAASFGLSRPTYYEARKALAREGLAGLLPRKRGPRGGHKMTREVTDFVQAAAREPMRPSVDVLVHRVRARFGLQVHPRTIERAMARRGKVLG